MFYIPSVSRFAFFLFSLISWIKFVGYSQSTPEDKEGTLPSAVPGLVGWYDAQTLKGTDGTEITIWPDRTDPQNNRVAHDLTQYTRKPRLDAQAPTLQTVAMNGFDYQAVRFSAGSRNKYEHLRHPRLVPDGHKTRSIVFVYRGGIDFSNSRPLGFGSTLVNDTLGTKVWNPATDGNYGSMRFDGAYIGPYTRSTSISRERVLLRTAVMHDNALYSDYIAQLDESFEDTAFLEKAGPNNPVGPIEGSFHVGDVQSNSMGGEEGAADFEIFEIVVYDRVLTDRERQEVQHYLKNKYTHSLKGRPESPPEIKVSEPVKKDPGTRDLVLGLTYTPSGDGGYHFKNSSPDFKWTSNRLQNVVSTEKDFELKGTVRVTNKSPASGAQLWIGLGESSSPEALIRLGIDYRKRRLRIVEGKTGASLSRTFDELSEDTTQLKIRFDTRRKQLTFTLGDKSIRMKLHETYTTIDTIVHGAVAIEGEISELTSVTWQ